jgi:hypothetical protein
MKKKAVSKARSGETPQLRLPGLETDMLSQPGTTQLALLGIEPDCLLAFLALVGLLRALDHARPQWCVRISWSGPPWVAFLHVPVAVSQAEIGRAAVQGIEAVASQFHVFEKSDVDFSPDEYREYLRQCRSDRHSLDLPAALCAEAPLSKNGKKLLAAPLVMMFGQGHQHFLSRLMAVSRRNSRAKKNARDATETLQGPEKIEEALFSPWKRADESPAFRWDPEEDQRYALRFRSPSGEGAASTVHGANRLACIGLLSLATVPNEPQARSVGVRRDDRGSNVEFVWPIWSAPISLLTLEALLVHPDVIAGRLQRVRDLGVTEIYCCRRIQNMKYLNVARARPTSCARESQHQ